MKKEALEVLRNRRAIRQFKAKQISKEELDSVLEAGTYAPTAGGTQVPVIVAVQDPYYGAPTILLVLVPEDSMLPDIDGSLVGGNLLNAAYAAGLGSCWIHRSKEMFEMPEGKELLKKWGLPEIP